MTDQSMTAIESAIQNLQTRRPKTRGRRQELAPYVDQLRQLIAAGWTRAEIVAEIKALGGKMSPALLRDVLHIAPAKPKRANQQKRPDPRAPAAPPAAPQTVPTTAPLYGQPPHEAE